MSIQRGIRQNGTCRNNIKVWFYFSSCSWVAKLFCYSQKTKWFTLYLLRSNKHIVCPVCNSYPLDEIIDKLRGSLFFAVFDTTKGLFHVPMDEKSKLLTVMLTPQGIYIYNVLAMGLADATDIFELCIHQLLQDLQGVLNIADDILVFGRTREEFNSNVISFLDRCIKEDIHLSPDKVQINTDNVPFFGHVLIKDGIQPDMSNYWKGSSWWLGCVFRYIRMQITNGSSTCR